MEADFSLSLILFCLVVNNVIVTSKKHGLLNHIVAFILTITREAIKSRSVYCHTTFYLHRR